MKKTFKLDLKFKSFEYIVSKRFYIRAYSSGDYSHTFVVYDNKVMKKLIDLITNTGLYKYKQWQGGLQAVVYQNLNNEMVIKSFKAYVSDDSDDAGGF